MSAAACNAAVATWVLAWAQVRNELRSRCNLPGRKSEWCDQARLLRVLPFSGEFGLGVQAYFNKRRWTNLPFSPQDWLLLSEWRECGIWRTAIERGIAEVFDKRDRNIQFGFKQINSLAYCEQAILRAQELAMEAAVGTYEYHGDYEPQRSPHTLLIALPPGRPIFQALQSQRQVDSVADQFQVGIVFTVAPCEYRKHLARERFGVELEFLDEHTLLHTMGLDPEPAKPFLSGSRPAGSAPRSGGAGSRRPFLNGGA